MAVKIPPPPRNVKEFEGQWKDWLYTMWRRVKGLEPGETDGGDSNAIHATVSGEVFTLSGKGVPVGADLLMIEDSADGYSKAKLTFTNLWHMEDSVKWYYGTGNDASIVYDGTDLIIKPDEVGTGDVVVDGHISLADSDTLKLGTGDDASVTYDGTNVVIDPKVVGTGFVDVTGTVRTDGRIGEINSTAKTGNYTVVATDENILCDTSGGAFTITLPASPETGRCYTVIHETAGAILTVSGNGNNINGSASITSGVAGNAIQLVYNGTQWNYK